LPSVGQGGYFWVMQQPQTDPAPAVSFNAAAAVADKLGCTFIVC